MMFETIFFSDNMLINILVMIEMYWMYFTALFGPALYYIFLKIFTFPLITRKSHDFVIMASPESVRIKKITSRIAPFFSFKKGLYWFSDSSEDENSLNRYSIYLEGINQPITETTRNDSKVHDVPHVYKMPRQISGHKIILPIRIKEHLVRHYKIILNAQSGKVRIEPAEQRQPLRVSFYHTMGIYIETLEQIQQEIEVGSAGKTVQIQLTTQLMMRQLKMTAETSNFSSSYAYEIWKECLNSNYSIVGNLAGDLDPKLVITLIAMMGIVGGIILYIMTYTDPVTALGPMPT